MPDAPDTVHNIVTDSLFPEAQQVIALVRSNIQWPFLLDAKLGDHNNEPMSDTVIAEVHDIPFNSIGRSLATIIHTLSRTDKQHGSPLGKTTQRANDVIARAAIANRHHRRPTLYSESTIGAFIKLGAAVPQHSPLIRAAGYVSPPPAVPRSHNVDFIITDIAAHMARSYGPQSQAQVLQALNHRQDLLANWPQLDLALFIHRVAGIRPDDRGFYHPDQLWGQHISTKRLVANTMLRIFARDQQPRTTAYLASETERLVGHLLPSQYNTTDATRAAAYESDEVSWQGLSTFGLKRWDTALHPQNMVSPRGRTGDLIYVYLMQYGPADIDDVIKHVQRSSKAKTRTVQEAVNHDPANRFIRLADGRMAANPIPRGHNPGTPFLTVVPDDDRHRPPPVVHESELLWLTHYLQALNELAPPLPARVTLTGARAAGFPLDDPMDITIVAGDDDRPSLEPRLAAVASAASDLVPSVQPQTSIMSPEQWEHQQGSEPRGAHHNIWLAPDAA